MRIFSALLAGVFAVLQPMPLHADSLPRFTEEREAAALHFVKKHCPELSVILEDLKKHHLAQYELQIREISQVTGMLAELDDARRHDLELKVWKTENKAFVVMAKLGSAREEEKKQLTTQLEEIARELVELEVQCLEATVESLEKEVAAAKEEIARTRENMAKSTKERYDALMEKVRKRRK